MAAAGRISRESIEQLLQHCDIVDVVSQVVTLKKAGSNYKGLCPFHDEKTPSFNVNPAKQIYKCFGCQKGGSAIGFVMEYQNVPFPDAVKILSDRYGVTLKYEGGEAPRKDRAREKLYEICRWAASFFEKHLQGEGGKTARGYLAERGISNESIERFRIGYAPDGWDNLLRAAARKQFSARELEQAGLVIPRRSGDGFYDRFRNRVLFPIQDPRNRVIAFGARVMPGGEEGQPKYINSPEGPIFSKGSHFYGLNVAGPASRDGLIVTEGYTDVISLNQAGVENVVATLGTAMTENHLRLLRRYTDQVTILFDADAAGQDAALRSIDMMLRERMVIRVLTLPDQKDPSDYVQEHGVEAFQEQLSHALELFEFLLHAVRRGNDVGTVSGRTAAVEQMVERIRKIPDDVKRAVMIRRTADEFEITSTVLEERLTPKRERRRVPVSADEPEDPARRKAEEDVVEIALHAPKLVQVIAELFTPDAFAYEPYRTIATAIMEQTAEDSQIEGSVLATELGGEAGAEIARLLAIGPKGENFLERLEETLHFFHARRLISDTRELTREVGEAWREKRNDDWKAALMRKQKLAREKEGLPPLENEV